MPRFVILEHDHPQLHWDLLLEVGTVLRAWRLAAPPQAGVLVDAQQSFDHRPAYLEYEGPVSGGRGRVVRWDGGSFAWDTEEEGRLVVRLHGLRLSGLLVLQRRQENGWRVLYTLEKH